MPKIVMALHNFLRKKTLHYIIMTRNYIDFKDIKHTFRLDLRQKDKGINLDRNEK